MTENNYRCIIITNIIRELYIDMGEKINLYINRYGYVYPSCKTYKVNPITHLANSTAVEEVFREFDKNMKCNSITVEFSALCHASCIYCFQKDGLLKKYPYFAELTKFLKAIQSDILLFSGGEILDQADTLAYLKTLRKVVPQTIFHLKTNGNTGLEKIRCIEEIFDRVVVSINGFSQCSYKTIMGNNMDLDVTKNFVENLVKRDSVSVGIKFLISPIVLTEICSFFEWALSIRPRCIIFQMVYIYKLFDNGKTQRVATAFDNCSNDYWEKIKKRTYQTFKTILSKCAFEIQETSLACDIETAQTLGWEDEVQKLFRMDGIYDLGDSK